MATQTVRPARRQLPGALRRPQEELLWAAGLVAAGAALRFSTLGLQSLWYDEAFGAVHLFNGSLGHLLSQLPKTENTPPLWYLLEWVFVQLLGRSAVALRLLSALAGSALVGVGFALGREVAGRRGAVICAALLAASPLFVWYSQEARAYSLYTLLLAVAVLCFLRAHRAGGRQCAALFGLWGALALLTHYFAAFLLVPMALYLVRDRARLARNWPAPLAVGLCGAALLPLAIAQGGRGAEWIARSSLLGRLEAIPQYYLTGYSGAPLGHAVELLVVLPLALGVVAGVVRLSDPRSGEGQALQRFVLLLGLALLGIVLPLFLIAFGKDYFDPRNVIGALVVASVAFAVALATVRPKAVGNLFALLSLAGLLAVSILVDFDPRLQRGDWSGVAKRLRQEQRALGLSGPTLLATVHLGSTPLQYYLPALRPLRSSVVTARNLVEVGYQPLAPDAGQSPAPFFHLRYRGEVNGLYLFVFSASRPQPVAAPTLLRVPLTPQAGRPALFLLGAAPA